MVLLGTGLRRSRTRLAGYIGRELGKRIWEENLARERAREVVEIGIVLPFLREIWDTLRGGAL